MFKKSRNKSSKGGSGPAAKNWQRARAASGKSRTRVPSKSKKKAIGGPSSHKSASKPLSKQAAEASSAADKRSCSGKSPQLVEGAKAPAFRLPRDGGEVVSLSDFSGQKLVLFFYPKANTPGCTREAMDFSRLAAAFAESGTTVLGISADAQRAQEAFRDKHKLNVPLMSDEKRETLEAYGAWGEKSMYGRTFLGIIRTTLLIGGDGRIKRIWRHVKLEGHAEEVLAAARAL
ncbi:MAG: redoxin domain-containing protein [Bradyrhizobium sp.]|nr:redoxin domain-containing protein [Bradyrhizobium sp.]